MQRFEPAFWSRWIMFLSFFLIIYGLMTVFATSQLNNILVIPLLFRDGFMPITEPELKLLNVLNGLTGALTVSWSIQIAWLAHKPFRNGEKWAWNAIAASTVVWAALEFYVKLTNGVNGIGLVAHFCLLLAFAIPLAITYRDFHS